MIEERRKGDRRIPPAVAQHLVEERGELLARIERLESEAAYAAAGFAAAREEISALKAQPSAGVDPIAAVLKDCLAEGVQPTFSGGDLKHLISLLEARPRLDSNAAGSGVVLPERMDVDDDDPYAWIGERAHNACLDEVARLNASATEAHFQARVFPWLLECFGDAIAGDTMERNHRFLEEALELVQACDCTPDEAHKLVDYVFGRRVGERSQEVGGVMVTLAALCLAQGLDMHQSGETELTRIVQPAMVERIREKQKAKPAMSPLPGVYPERLNPCRAQSVMDERTAMVSVTQADANNYCLILSELGMEEEGDPVAEVKRLQAINASRAQSVADSYVLVPVDPTPEMIQAGRDEPLAGTDDDDAPEDYRAVYKAMIAAAPSAKKESE